MDFIDVIYFINLDRRNDRLQQIAGEFEKMKIPISKIIRVKAYEHEIGTIGCSKSHIWALKHFIESRKKRCMILEDDFEFTESHESVERILGHIFKRGAVFDCLMLTGNGVSVFDNEDDHANYLQRTAFSNTTAGYITTDKFAQTLLHNFDQGVRKQENWVNVYGKHETALNIDFHWIYSLVLGKIYFTYPKLGRQRTSLSDIFPLANYNLGHLPVEIMDRKYIGGLNDINIIYYINLDKRLDRLEQITGELEKISVPPEKVQRISAIGHKFGIFGSIQSHCLTLKTFIESGKDICLILEDDFEFTKSREKIDEILAKAFMSSHDIGCLMLNGTQNATMDENSQTCIQQVIFSTSCPAFIVTKAYAPALLYNFLEAAGKQEKWIKAFGAPENAFNLDYYWIFEQVHKKFFFTVPMLGKQRDSPSDITTTSGVTMSYFDPEKHSIIYN
jgi:glycosyl transferase family 25